MRQFPKIGALQDSPNQARLKVQMILPSNKKYIAYFCNEFGIDNDLPTYSGGLGILAGDLMNATADADFPILGIGILYRGKQFMQHITGEGKEEQRDSEFDHDTSFLRPTTINGKPLLIDLLDNSEVLAKSYHIRLADSTVLFFLSTNIDGNQPDWISDMDALYKGGAESQIRQQILLGIGGVKLLKNLGVKASLYHINEGRPAFLIWEIVANLMEDEKLSFEEAWQKAKESIVYTNHTLVSAGNPKYEVNLIAKWAKAFAKKLEVDEEKLIKDGLSLENKFDLSKFAISIAKKHSCVSKVHAKYAKREWPNCKWIPITNGVHIPRWQDSDFRTSQLSDRALWDLHITKKKELVATVLKRTGFEYDPNRLVVSWARRLAEYKQPRIIFSDLARLKNILTNSEKPVQLLFAGNSHSGDPNAKSIIEEIISVAASELSGYLIFIPNYNISLANHLVSGSDLWLNTPKGNLEACGTSGMKAISNGVLNCTVLDGWTHEVDWGEIGWLLDPKSASNSFYELMEQEIVPIFYQRNEDGLPEEWIIRMKKSIEVSKNFSASQTLLNYQKKLYS